MGKAIGLCVAACAAGRKTGLDMPNDAAMLLSLVNMKLRDGSPSPEELCEECGWDCAELYRRLASIGCIYDEEKNRFY